MKTIHLEFPKILGYILVNGLGMIPESKVFTNPKIPEFLLKSRTNIKRAFIQQAFDDERSIHIRKSGKAIQLRQHNSDNEPPFRLTQLKELIESLGIIVNEPFGSTQIYDTKKCYTSYGWGTQISNQSNMWLFAQKINFNSIRKREKLREILNSYITPPRFKNGFIETKILDTCLQLKKENQKITIKNISEKLGKNESWIAEVSRNLIKENKLVVIKKASSNNGFLPKEFDLPNL